MPIPIDNRSFSSPDDAVSYLIQSKKYSSEAARSIVDTIQKHVRGATLYGSIPELSTSPDGKHYARFFLLNANTNSRDWDVTPESIPQFIHSFKGMPYTDEPNMEHFGAEHMEVAEVLKKQEDYRAGTIVDVKYSPEKGEAYAVVEVHDEAVWKELNEGKGIYVSPAVAGQGVQDGMGHITFTKWYGLHLARVGKPAYGVMQASIKETCTGDGDFCVNHLMATAAMMRPMIAVAAMKNNSYMPTQCSHTQMQQTSGESQIVQPAAALNGDQTPIGTPAKDATVTPTGLPINNPGQNTPGHLQTAKALNDIGNPDKKNTNVDSKTGAAKPDPNEPDEDDKNMATEFASLKAKVAAMEEKEKTALASEITAMEKDADILTGSEENRIQSLMASSKEALEAHVANFQPYYNKIMDLKSRVPGYIAPASTGPRVVQTPAVASGPTNDIITLDDARSLGLLD